MFEGLNTQLAELQKKRRAKKHLETRLSKAEKNIAREKDRLRILKQGLRRERADVDKLEGLSLTGLFHQILGTRDTKLDKERQEFLAAKLKHDECERSLAALEQEVTSVKNQIENIGDPEVEYDAILKKKESLILKAEDHQLARLSERLADLQADIKELEEAVDEGQRALDGLESVVASLKRAKDWGTFDIIGGGIVVTAIKHSQIDHAKEEVYDVQQSLRRFESELSDLSIRPDSELGIDIDSLTKFADHFFDNLIFDWVVQTKIKRTLDGAVKMKKVVEKLTKDLQQKLAAQQKKRAATEAEKTKLIERA